MPYIIENFRQGCAREYYFLAMKSITNCMALLCEYKFTVLVFLYSTAARPPPYTMLNALFTIHTFLFSHLLLHTNINPWMTWFWQCQSWMSLENNYSFSVKSFQTYRTFMSDGRTKYTKRQIASAMWRELLSRNVNPCRIALFY